MGEEWKKDIESKYGQTDTQHERMKEIIKQWKKETESKYRHER